MTKPIAIFFGVDSGGQGFCNTQPAPLKAKTEVKNTVFANKSAVMVNGDVLTPAPGITIPIPVPVPCQSPRIAVATSKKVFVNKKNVALQLDILNSANKINIPKGAPNVVAS